MASIRKKGNGYEISVYLGRDSNGKKICPSTTFIPDPALSKTKQEKELQKFADKFEDDLKNNRINGVSDAQAELEARRMSLSSLADLFFHDLSPYIDTNQQYKLEKTTYCSYKSSYDLRIKPLVGHVLIWQMNGRVSKMYANKLREDGIRQDGKPGHLSEGTIKKDLALISSILSYGVEEGYLNINPLIYAGRTRRVKNTSSKYTVTNLTVEQTKAFLWALDNTIPVKREAHDRKGPGGKLYHVPEYTQDWNLELKWRFFFYLLVFLGDRRGEQVSLRWSDLNFDTGEVNIDTSTAKAGGEVYQKDTKTHASRTAIVPLFVMKLGKELRAKQIETSIQIGDQWLGFRGKQFNKNFAFQTWNGKQMDLCSPRTEFKRIIRIYNDNIATEEADKIPNDVTLHSLRHTAAAILISNGLDPRSVADILGHADPSTTLNIYSYFFRKKHQEAANIMSSVLVENQEFLKVSGICPENGG